jgi:hypothetical protein
MRRLSPARLPGRDLGDQGDDGVAEVLAQLVRGDVLVVIGEYEEEDEQGTEGTAEADPDGRIGSRVGQQGGEPLDPAQASPRRSRHAATAMRAAA